MSSPTIHGQDIRGLVIEGGGRKKGWQCMLLGKWRNKGIQMCHHIAPRCKPTIKCINIKHKWTFISGIIIIFSGM